MVSGFFPRIFLVFGFFGLILSCGARGGKTEQEHKGEAVSPPPRPLAILKAGANPLWFELAEGGPRLINSPGEAVLGSFIPWPLARHIRGMLPVEGGLVMAVNRDGFLEAAARGAEGPEAALYRSADPGIWGTYSTVSLFLYEGTPAVLLCRDDFFSDSPAPLPSPRVYLAERGLRPRGLDLPFFADLRAEEGWDVEALRYGADRLWYCRAMKKNSAEPAIVFLRGADLARRGEAATVSAFRGAARPETPEAAPPLLRRVLEEVFSYGEGTAVIISGDFPGPRYFARPSGNRAAEDGLALNGYYCGGLHGFALALLPDGRGCYAAETPAGTGGAGKPEGAETVSFSLPSLPERYVYTGIGLCGEALFASWEEQEGHGIGAAGFMVMTLF
jgi:hypothetical protein